jgi:hypothetical protein
LVSVTKRVIKRVLFDGVLHLRELRSPRKKRRSQRPRI